MQNGLLKLDLASLADAIVLAVTLAVVGALYSVVMTTGFDVFTADWGSIGRMMVNISFTTSVISLSKDLLSTYKGSVLNLTPEATTPQV